MGSGAGDDGCDNFPIGCSNKEIMIIIRRLNERMSKIEVDTKLAVSRSSGHEKSWKYVENLKNEFLLPLNQTRMSSKEKRIRKILRYHLRIVSGLVKRMEDKRMEDLENI